MPQPFYYGLVTFYTRFDARPGYLTVRVISPASLPIALCAHLATLHHYPMSTSSASSEDPQLLAAERKSKLIQVEIAERKHELAYLADRFVANARAIGSEPDACLNNPGLAKAIAAAISRHEKWVAADIAAKAAAGARAERLAIATEESLAAAESATKANYAKALAAHRLAPTNATLAALETADHACSPSAAARALREGRGKG